MTAFFDLYRKGMTAQHLTTELCKLGFVELRREKEAQAELGKLLETNPDFSIEAYVTLTKRILPFKDYTFLDRQIELLRKAGLK